MFQIRWDRSQSNSCSKSAGIEANPIHVPKPMEAKHGPPGLFLLAWSSWSGEYNSCSKSVGIEANPIHVEIVFTGMGRGSLRRATAGLLHPTARASTGALAMLALNCEGGGRLAGACCGWPRSGLGPEWSRGPLRVLGMGTSGGVLRRSVPDRSGPPYHVPNPLGSKPIQFMFQIRWDRSKSVAIEANLFSSSSPWGSKLTNSLPKRMGPKPIHFMSNRLGPKPLHFIANPRRVLAECKELCEVARGLGEPLAMSDVMETLKGLIQRANFELLDAGQDASKRIHFIVQNHWDRSQCQFIVQNHWGRSQSNS